MIAYVVIGGALGALVRFFTERWSVHRFHERMPWGTLIVNLTGSLILGIAFGLHQRGSMSDGMLALIGTGFCGALTTFSGWIGQIYTRGRHAETRGIATAYFGLSLFVGITLVYFGHALTLINPR